MDKELKAKWLTALRSGEYKQCRQTLSDGKGYCCIGVLGEITSTFEFGYEVANREIGHGASIKLQTMNDGGKGVKKHTFKQIANYIERNL